jgi:hypothetical protein
VGSAGKRPLLSGSLKLERGHVKDLLAAEEMLRRGLIERSELLRLFTAIEPELVAKR